MENWGKSPKGHPLFSGERDAGGSVVCGNEHPALVPPCQGWGSTLLCIPWSFFSLCILDPSRFIYYPHAKFELENMVAFRNTWGSWGRRLCKSLRRCKWSALGLVRQRREGVGKCSAPNNARVRGMREQAGMDKCSRLLIMMEDCGNLSRACLLASISSENLETRWSSKTMNLRWIFDRQIWRVKTSGEIWIMWDIG